MLAANCRWLGVEFLIGHFVNTVVLPIEIVTGMTLGNLLDVTREGVAAIHQNQEFPFDALARRMEKELGFNRKALCQGLVAYNIAQPSLDFSLPQFCPV